MDYRSLLEGTTCKACGAPDARPARPMFAHDYRYEDVDRHTPVGRILLCGACAEVHRRSVSAERSLRLLWVVPVLLALLTTFVPRTPSYGAMVLVLLASTLAMVALHRGIARRLAVRALVLGVRSTQVTVWLARTSAPKMPLRAMVHGVFGGYALASALSLAMLSALWTFANPAIEVSSTLDAPATLIVDGEQGYDVPVSGRGYVRVAFGTHRFEWAGAPIPPLEFRTLTRGFRSLRVALPECNARDRDANPRRFRYAWHAQDGSLSLRCHYLDGAPP